MRVAIYLRVSTGTQDIENQRPALEAFASSRGWEVSATYAENESAWHGGPGAPPPLGVPTGWQTLPRGDAATHKPTMPLGGPQRPDLASAAARSTTAFCDAIFEEEVAHATEA